MSKNIWSTFKNMTTIQQHISKLWAYLITSIHESEYTLLFLRKSKLKDKVSPVFYFFAFIILLRSQTQVQYASFLTVLRVVNFEEKYFGLEICVRNKILFWSLKRICIYGNNLKIHRPHPRHFARFKQRQSMIFCNQADCRWMFEVLGYNISKKCFQKFEFCKFFYESEILRTSIFVRTHTNTVMPRNFQDLNIFKTTDSEIS